jgi:predicted flap endonuclease-1-like 5' DNA nuclease
MTKLLDIAGIGEVQAAKLKAAGIQTVEGLLAQGCSPQGRKEIAEKAEIDEALILQWVNHADLFRVKGVAGQYAELLEAAGVDTVVELASRNPKSLLEKMVMTNSEKKIVRAVPNLNRVRTWISQARKIPRVVEY